MKNKVFVLIHVNCIYGIIRLLFCVIMVTTILLELQILPFVHPRFPGFARLSPELQKEGESKADGFGSRLTLLVLVSMVTFSRASDVRARFT